MILDDGSVVPHFISVGSTSGYAQSSGQYDNYCLRVGEVIAVTPPDSPNSLTRRVYEYSVIVQERQGESPTIITNYEHCYVANLFGSASDKFTYTLRPSTDPSKAEQGQYTNGSKVLILCLNGETNNAFIVGAIWDPTVEAEDAALGHHLQFEFNGITSTINKDGEVQVTFNGANDADGKTLDSQDAANVGAFWNMLKDGTFNISAPKHVTIKSTGVLTGDATDHTVLGDTYRQAEDKMLQSLTDSLNQLSSALFTVSAIFNAAKTAGSVPALAGFIGACAPPMNDASTAATDMAKAIQDFESHAADYLSKKNLSD